MQEHAKLGYIFGHLSLIRNLALNIPNRVAIVRDWGKFPLSDLKKEILVPFRATFFLGKWCRVTTYFLYKKEKKN